MRLEIRWRSGAYEVVDMDTQPVKVHGRHRMRGDAREQVRELMFPPAPDQVRPRAPDPVVEIKQVEPLAVKTAPPKKKAPRKKAKKSAKRSKKS